MFNIQCPQYCFHKNCYLILQLTQLDDENNSGENPCVSDDQHVQAYRRRKNLP